LAFGRGSEWLKFPCLTSREEAKFFAPPPNLQICEACQRHERAKLKLDIAEADKR
jgi:hypothetical protein